MKKKDGSVELSLVIPAYNEVGIITRNIDELHSWLGEHMPKLCYEILIVDDGSTDGMGELLDKYANNNTDTRIVHHEVNMGRGRGVRTGFEHSIGRFIICLDADLSYSPSHIPPLLEPLQDGIADITLASAYHPQGSVKNVPISRALLSKWGNIFFSAGVDKQLRTVTCIVRGFTRKVADELELVSDGKQLHIEILQKAMMLGYRLIEIPAHLNWRDRNRTKKSKKGLLSSIPLLSMSDTITSHLIYNWMLSPGVVLFAPMITLLLIVLGGTFLMVGSFLERLLNGADGYQAYDFYNSLRDTMVSGNLTLFLIFISLILLLMFVVFYFISHQNRKNFEEIYVLLTRINNRLKELESRMDK